ncbi:MAG: hypothetical protein EP340_11530 [Alphaproteobacteria bacterium]|nr:MAG: hypothetical protein EP340_11530 [Alphaproteobacteria bacterium]
MGFKHSAMGAFWGLWTAFTLLAGAPAQGAEVAPSSPEATIAQFNAALLEAIHTPEDAGFEARRAIMESAVQEAFDMPLLARRTMSRSVWSEWTPEQKRLYVDTLQDYQAAVLADRFKPGADVTFVIDGVEDSVQGTKLVKTRILRAEDEDVKLNYLTADREEVWRVVDIYLNSTISEVAMRRSEYSAIVAAQGFDGLIDALNAQIETIISSHNPVAVGASSAVKLPAAVVE